MSILSFHDLGLKQSILKAAERKARSEGLTAPQYVRGLIERDLLADKSFDEILAPARADARQGGLTEVQLDGIVERARRAELRRKRKARP